MKQQTAALTHSAALVSLFLLSPHTAQAHTETIAGGSLVSGFAHPILGWDHVLAMVAVGLWGAILGSPAIWLLPVLFPLVMAVSAGLGILDVPLPGVETGIAASAVVLGLLILFTRRLPMWAAVAIVALFALFHGHAHGAEIPYAANPFAFAVGFVIATGMLHLIGVAFGLLTRWPAGAYAVRAGGGIISAFGLAFLLGVA